MSNAADHPSAEDERDEAQKYRHLPKVISVEDTVASMRSDSAPDQSGERNVFIAAAINAGG